MTNTAKKVYLVTMVMAIQIITMKTYTMITMISISEIPMTYSENFSGAEILSQNSSQVKESLLGLKLSQILYSRISTQNVPYVNCSIMYTKQNDCQLL